MADAGRVGRQAQVNTGKGIQLGFLFGMPSLLIQLWRNAIFVRGWSIVYLINDSTDKMVCLGVLTYT